MFYAFAIAILLFIALIMAASPLIAVVVMIPLIGVYFALRAATRKSDELRGTQDPPHSFKESISQAEHRPDKPAPPKPHSGTAPDPDREPAPPPPP